MIADCAGLQHTKSIRSVNPFDKDIHWGIGIRIVWIPIPPFSDLLSKQILSKLVWIPRPQCDEVKGSFFVL
jgi:hypothetical protein